MLNKITILVLCLFSVAFAQTLMRTDGGKVKVDFFYESLCPYCQQFMERSLKKAAATPVTYLLFRISGKFVIFLYILMVMLGELLMEQAGFSLANMGLENVKET